MPEPSPLRNSAEVLKLKVVFLVDRKPDHKDIDSNTPIPDMIKVRGDYCRVVFFYINYFPL